MKKALSLHSLKPRNPFVVAGLRRKAGSHRASETRHRQAACARLRSELKHLHPPGP